MIDGLVADPELADQDQTAPKLVAPKQAVNARGEVNVQTVPRKADKEAPKVQREHRVAKNPNVPIHFRNSKRRTARQLIDRRAVGSFDDIPRLIDSAFHFDMLSSERCSLVICFVITEPNHAQHPTVMPCHFTCSSSN